jgi:hypothetical protein
MTAIQTIPNSVAGETPPASTEPMASGPGSGTPLPVCDEAHAARRNQRKLVWPRFTMIPMDPDEAAMLEQHLVEFEEAMAAARETLNECDALAAAKAKAASGN